jgi:hypothetical protein
MLVVLSAITIRTIWLQQTIIILHIGDMLSYYHPSLCRFENIGVIWSILWYSMDTVLSVEASQLLVASSTITIWTSWLQGRLIILHIGDMIAYYHPTLCTFENIGVF